MNVADVTGSDSSDDSLEEGNSHNESVLVLGVGVRADHSIVELAVGNLVGLSESEHDIVSAADAELSVVSSLEILVLELVSQGVVEECLEERMSVQAELSHLIDGNLAGSPSVESAPERLNAQSIEVDTAAVAAIVLARESKVDTVDSVREERSDTDTGVVRDLTSNSSLSGGQDGGVLADRGHGLERVLSQERLRDIRFVNVVLKFGHLGARDIRSDAIRNQDVVQSKELRVVVDLSRTVLRQAVLLAHSPGLEDTSRVAAVQASVVVVVESSESVVDIGVLVESVVQAQLSLEHSQSVAERRALVLGARVATADILAVLLARLAALLAGLAARLLALVDAGRLARVALLVAEITADINLHGVRGVTAVADLLLVALTVRLLGLTRGSQRNAALSILADALALLDTVVVPGHAAVVAINACASARSAGLTLVRLLGIARSALGAGSAAGLLRVPLGGTSLSRSVAFLGSESSSVLVAHNRSGSVFRILSSVVDSLRTAVRLAGTAILLTVNVVVGTASLVAIDSDVLEQPRVGNVLSIAGLQQVLEELVGRILGVAREARGSRSVLNVLARQELGELRKQGIASVHELIQIVIEITERTGQDVVTTVLVLLEPADDLVDLTLLAAHTLDTQRESAEADVDVNESSSFVLEEENQRVDAGNLLGLRAEVQRLSDKSKNATVVVGIVLVESGVLVHLVESHIVAASHGEQIVSVVQAIDLAAVDESLSESNTVRAETGKVVKITDSSELFGLKTIGVVLIIGKSVSDGLHTAQLLKEVRDHTLVDVLNVVDVGLAREQGDGQHQSFQTVRHSVAIATGVAVIDHTALIVEFIALSVERAHFQSIVS